ncbi:hypothetical protein F4677DRAFT_440338 [Hypoxylon crocopeplum]|nr:hypothetical protein F4677DRAFT_440338 [Hypoxylon crocopeplum]
MEPRSLKKLAPAPASPSSGDSQTQISVPVPGPRRNLTRNCDGNRPTCGRCQKAGDTCVYEVNKRDMVKLQLLSDYDTARLQNFELIFGILQNGTDHQASELVAQIRSGASVDTLASAFNASIPRPSSSTLSSPKRPMVGIGTGSSTTRDGSGDPSTTVVSQGFLDLLFDRNDWLQSAENGETHNNEINPEVMQVFVPNPVPQPALRTYFSSDRFSSDLKKTYDFPMPTEQNSTSSRNPYSEQYSEQLDGE